MIGIDTSSNSNTSLVFFSTYYCCSNFVECFCGIIYCARPPYVIISTFGRPQYFNPSPVLDASPRLRFTSCLRTCSDGCLDTLGLLFRLRHPLGRTFASCSSVPLLWCFCAWLPGALDLLRHYVNRKCFCLKCAIKSCIANCLLGANPFMIANVHHGLLLLYIIAKFSNEIIIHHNIFYHLNHNKKCGSIIIIISVSSIIK